MKSKYVVEGRPDTDIGLLKYPYTATPKYYPNASVTYDTFEDFEAALDRLHAATPPGATRDAIRTNSVMSKLSACYSLAKRWAEIDAREARGKARREREAEEAERPEREFQENEELKARREDGRHKRKRERLERERTEWAESRKAIFASIAASIADVVNTIDPDDHEFSHEFYNRVGVAAGTIEKAAVALKMHHFAITSSRNFAHHASAKGLR